MVRGRVVGAGPGHRVRAYDKDMRSEELLGEAAIEAEEYEIAYSRMQFARAEKGSGRPPRDRAEQGRARGGVDADHLQRGPVEVAPDSSCRPIDCRSTNA